MNGLARVTIAAVTLAAWLAWSAPALSQAPVAEPGKVVGLAFIGRVVGDLDKSVAFYKSLGFSQDPAAPSAWREDEVTEHLYGVRGIQTRMAKMFINSNASGQRFVVYLRELKGIKRRNLTDHTPWEPAASHFGLIVPDAQALWSQLKTNGTLRARSWGGELIAPPGQTRRMLAYLTDPDGLDIEIIDQRPATPAENGRPARPALLPGVNHVGLVVLNLDTARAFYGNLLGGQPQATEPPWLQGDFYDSAVGGHGNILRLFNLSFAEAATPEAHLNFELVEYQNRKKAVEAASITDIGVAYAGFEVKGLDAFLARAQAAGAKVVSDGIVTMKSGTREVMVRDPDVGGFVLLFEHPAK